MAMEINPEPPAVADGAGENQEVGQDPSEAAAIAYLGYHKLRSHDRQAFGFCNGLAYGGLAASPLILKVFHIFPHAPMGWIGAITVGAGIVGGVSRQLYITKWDSEKSETDVVSAVDFEFASYMIDKNPSDVSPRKAAIAGAMNGAANALQGAAGILSDVSVYFAVNGKYVWDTVGVIIASKRSPRDGQIAESKEIDAGGQIAANGEESASPHVFEDYDQTYQRWKASTRAWLAARHVVADPAAKPASRAEAIKMIAAKVDGPSPG